MESKLNVFFKNKLVGTIAELNNVYVFQYSDEWIENGFSISPFSLPLKKQLFTPKIDPFNGMFGVFADSMPDAWGRLLLDRYLNKHKKGDVNELTRLTYINDKGMGALEYKPSYANNDEMLFPDLDEFQKQANLILDNELCDFDTLFMYGGSSGGARPKALVKYNNESWIIKFQSKYDINNVGKMEYDYALACKKIGINFPEVKMFDNKYFGVKRFDRINNEKVHMISIAALVEVNFREPCLDYLDLFKITKIVTNENKNDIDNLFLRMCFNVYAHNLDDHAKNFSFIYDEDSKNYRLSPAYDMTYSNTYFGEHTTSVNGKGKNICDEDLITIGIKSGIKKQKCVIMLETVKKTVEEDLKKYLN